MSRTHKDRKKVYRCKCEYCISARKKKVLDVINLKEIKENKIYDIFLEEVRDAITKINGIPKKYFEEN